jgi:hypothetical protein
MSNSSILEEYSAAILAIRTNPFLDDHLFQHAPPRADITDWTDVVCDPSNYIHPLMPNYATAYFSLRW